MAVGQFDAVGILPHRLDDFPLGTDEIGGWHEVANIARELILRQAQDDGAIFRRPEIVGYLLSRAGT